MGQVVIVTGAASGIGRCIALEFAKRGDRLLLVDINPEALDSVQAEVDAAGASSSECHIVDCSKGEAIEAFSEKVLANESVDVLCNNAGVAWIGPAETMSLEDWRFVIDLDLWGVIHGCRTFAPAMLERGSGTIVNTASVAGLVGAPYFAAYSAAKHGVVGLSQALDREYRDRGVRVIAICPSFVRTNIGKDARYNMSDDGYSHAVSTVMSRAAEPEQVARAVVRAVRKKQTIVVVPFFARMMWWLLRINPRFGDLSVRAVRKIRAREQREG